jgi:FeS assembly SUF system protein
MLRDRIVEVLKTVRDPEIPVNVYDLGLVYGIDVDDDGKVEIRMTLTTPGCPAARLIPEQVRSRIAKIPGVLSASVELVWDPPWTRDRLSEDAKLELGL